MSERSRQEADADWIRAMVAKEEELGSLPPGGATGGFGRAAPVHDQERGEVRKPLVVLAPVEFGCRSWGPFQWEHRRVYYPDGSDWTGQWSLGLRGLGQIAIIPPAWLLNIFVRLGVARDARHW